MRLLAVSGSYRKGKTIESLTHAAIGAAREIVPDLCADFIRRVDQNIRYCTNCESCKRDDPGMRYARCVLDDDMQKLHRLIDEADGYILGCPVNMGHATAVMKAFCERVCWVFGKPGLFPLKGCPSPRTKCGKKAIILVSSGLIPPWLRRFCDQATPLMKEVLQTEIGARVIGSMYAGAVHKRGAEYYIPQAQALGRKLAG